ncbi:ArnT family glycosyltransferase [Aquicella lusitana]|uniref:4-amino-4-deoxy-L-arabinose transferase-like glycosyltransferase n=1 Tax=Aquicella lusitana TaxID=254246 RepID=A0A370GSA3_9COXI|nr:glycosyltransferase family 39 protein [Aquicella lusitana]RDI44813.1 4-amino-4-deoxy-L-arabinose transferase-like glycosyltransferase [Aquicella lusitana]VVC73010.1 Undecaprenyl phosphate-alpha-4-amino-4-deoxy-L-arabinose arabinosyl transferase [Aquicella lusitana]
MMKQSSMAEFLWGHRGRFSYLLIAALLLLFTLLGARELWTQEHRWADIVFGMFYRNDFLHPYLGKLRYYDKPLLSYWFIAAVAKLTGALTTWELRLPSALAGLLALWAVYRLGAKLRDRQLGLLAGWLLLTTFYFVFWARTSSADMLNLTGSVCAVAWYFEKRENAGFFAYFIFFTIVALTALCKGLVGMIVPSIAVLVDMCMQKSWKQHLRPPLFIALIPAMMIYLFPFWASSYFGGESYGQNGLYLVYRENILRYFQPFDHKGPIYTYFLYLPIYLLPWTLFFIPALFTLKSRWKTMSNSSRWIAWTLLLLFLFFTLSGSRRSYYILPIVPFAVLFTADWLLSDAANAVKRRLWSAGWIVTVFLLLFLTLDILQTGYYLVFGPDRFATALKEEAGKIKPWDSWRIVSLDAEAKLSFYLQLPPDYTAYGIKGDRKKQAAEALEKAWPIIKSKPENTIFITRKVYAPALQSILAGYRMVEVSYPFQATFLKEDDINAPVAFMPDNPLV